MRSETPGPDQYHEIYQKRWDLDLTSNHNKTKNIVFSKDARFRDIPHGSIRGSDQRSYDIRPDSGKIVSFPKEQRFKFNKSEIPGSGAYEQPGLLDQIPSYIKSTIKK